jgi:hypothetical protein
LMNGSALVGQQTNWKRMNNNQWNN